MFIPLALFAFPLLVHSKALVDSYACIMTKLHFLIVKNLNLLENLLGNVFCFN